MADTNYYQVLGLPSTASLADLRAAYSALLRRHHPDVAGDLPERLLVIQRAYHCLADPATRAAHDRDLAQREQQHEARQRRIRRRLDSYDHHHPRASLADLVRSVLRRR